MKPGYVDWLLTQPDSEHRLVRAVHDEDWEATCIRK